MADCRPLAAFAEHVTQINKPQLLRGTCAKQLAHRHRYRSHSLARLLACRCTTGPACCHKMSSEMMKGLPPRDHPGQPRDAPTRQVRPARLGVAPALFVPPLAAWHAVGGAECHFAHQPEPPCRQSPCFTPSCPPPGRDFTANALLYEPLSNVLFDYVGGVHDLVARGALRACGEPAASFADDPARVLRGVRVAARVGESWRTCAAQAPVMWGPSLPHPAPVLS